VEEEKKKMAGGVFLPRTGHSQTRFVAQPPFIPPFDLPEGTE
jgi:hypothetical protein